MKELSIEEKAKRYDEAIEIARQIHDADRVSGIELTTCEEIFPELAESDERIRKEITELVMQPTWKTEKEFHRRNELCVWLEKQGEIIKEWSEMKFNNIQTELQEMVDLKRKTEQGEQKLADKIQLGKKYKCIASPRYSTFMMGEIYKPEDKFLCSLMNFCSDCFEPIEDEQKPADKVEPKFKVGQSIRQGDEVAKIVDVSEEGYHCDNAFVPFTAQDSWELVEQKPAWSEEDTKMVGNIRSIIEKYAFSQSAVDVNGELCEKEYIEADNWLKSLKDRVQPQPKQEWSDEDIPMSYGKELESKMNEACRRFGSQDGDAFTLAEVFYAGVEAGKGLKEQKCE